jgi:ribosomal protein L32E
MVQKKFKRTNFANYSKLGVRRKNKQKYRRGIGLDNKMRLNMKGHLKNVRVGFRTAKKTRDLIGDLKPVTISNVKDLTKVKQGMIGMIAKVGNKNKKEILEYATKNNIKINLDAKKELSKIEDKLKQSKEKKQERKAKKIAKDKKAQKEAEKKAQKEAKAEKKELENKEGKGSSEDAEKKSEDKKEIKPEQKKPKEPKKDTLTNNYGRGK